MSEVWERTMQIGEIPVLGMATHEGPYPGTILVYHGLRSCKEDLRKELYWLAEAGFLAVGVDAVGHGERRSEDLQARLMGPDWRKAFKELAEQTLAELPALLDELGAMEQDNSGPLALVGISLGGYIAFAAAGEPRLRAIVPILACPELAANGSEIDLERFNGTAVLAVNAGQDQHVPTATTREFMQRLGGEYLEYPESGHFMREQDWHDAWDRILEWLNRTLEVDA